MPVAARSVKTYRQVQAQASTPLELVLLLYDGALRFMERAREAIARRDIPARRTAISQSMAIVGELQATLDMDRGGEIAFELDRLYAYVLARLMDATLKNDAAAIDDACKVFAALRDGWRTIASQPAAGLGR